MYRHLLKSSLPIHHKQLVISFKIKRSIEDCDDYEVIERSEGGLAFFSLVSRIVEMERVRLTFLTVGKTNGFP